jgi:hypothetical protein
MMRLDRSLKIRFSAVGSGYRLTALKNQEISREMIFAV